MPIFYQPLIPLKINLSMKNTQCAFPVAFNGTRTYESVQRSNEPANIALRTQA